MSFKAKMTGGFKAGVLEGVKKQMRGLDKASIVVGYPAGKEVAAPTKTGDGHEPMDNMSEVATLAKINDSHRPFLKAGVKQGQQEIKRAWGRALNDVLTQRLDAKAGAALVGEVAVGQVKKHIRDGNHKPNTRETIKAKGSSRPLIDTSQMLNSTTFEVRMG